MIDYFIKNSDMFLNAFFEHLWIVFVTLVISVILAMVMTYVLLSFEKLGNLINHIFAVTYSVPSLALFAMLIPVLGLGKVTAIFVLIMYNQYILLRNFLTGMLNVDYGVLEAGRGMGMNKWQLVTKIQVPLALPSIIAGIRLAIISTTGIATIAATINAGGLGAVLFSGLKTFNMYKLLWGTILCVFIALVADIALKQIEKSISSKWR
ncbi:glycine betaine/L-proline ABC transporter, permease subunit [Campylobacter blaseri]|uniref:Glycine/betaine ABC transporter permease n=1 Tax=Campylobacter blaseri TaxID=2042961 RepID=A0A2P8R0C7_9BACT|nr:ABC transporter permease [Campylobacter blaseri]PSM51954.1 glycine/betaine ABC transporter permease [Campylobacter blaseri]PSM53739.1 glycine/betaine ABC transporter permease [Campylobacter blaseri]QKF85705.1 glycine betaine/L-proline ABC transporter, permease subunit [Campylobacter blaseri]